MRPIEWRRIQLYRLGQFVKENLDALTECLCLDLGRPKQETMMGDLGPSLERILINASKLEEWIKPIELSVSPWQESWRPRVEKHPKGVVLIVVWVLLLTSATKLTASKSITVDPEGWEFPMQKSVVM
jgi:aldehyde dehydrogenase (NAD+)